MEYTLGLATLIMLGVNIFVGFALPIGLFVFFHRRYRCTTRAFIVGSSAMIVVGLGMEFLVSKLVVVTGADQVLYGNPWIYSLFAGVTTGLLQEPLRYAYMRFFMKEEEQSDDHNALMFGAGYGGLNALTYVAMGAFTNFGVALMVYQGHSAALLRGFSGQGLEDAKQALDALCSSSALNFLMISVEHCIETVCQMGLSTLVWFAVKGGKPSRNYLFAAILLHMIYKMATTLMGIYVSSGLVVQLVNAAVAAGIVYLAVRVWNKEYTDPMLAE